MKINKVLIVGCPKSGTTLLQAILSAHPKIFSLPETHFYPLLCSGNRMIRKLGISSKHARLIVMDLEKKYLGKNNIKPSFFSKTLSTQYINILNEITKKRNFITWIEKTPQNLLFLPFIKSFSKDIKFIHIERDPKDVIASIHYASTKHPKSWGYSNLEDAIQICLESHIMNKKFKGMKNHFYCSYEELVQYPNDLIRNILDFLSLEFVLDQHHIYVSEKPDSIINKDEVWKNSVFQELKYIKSKFYTHLSTDQQAKVLEKIKSFDNV